MLTTSIYVQPIFFKKKEHFSFIQIIKWLGLKCDSGRVDFFRGDDLRTCRLLPLEFTPLTAKNITVCVVEQFRLICVSWFKNI